MFDSKNKNAVFVAVGPRAGKNHYANGFQFVDGKCEVRVSALNYESVSNYMRLSFQAFLEGSDELAAKEKWYQEEALKDGKSKLNSAPVSGVAKSVLSDSGSNGDKITPQTPAQQPVPAPTETGSAGSLPIGSGLSDTWKPK